MKTVTARATRPPQSPAADTRDLVAEYGLIDALAELSFLIHSLLADAAAQHDLSIIQTRVLGVLRDHTPTMTELGGHLDLDKASITGLVDRAQRRGLVTRTVNANDRRSHQVSITDTGRQLAERVNEHFEQRIEGLATDLTNADRQQLAQLARRLLQRR